MATTEKPGITKRSNPGMTGGRVKIKDRIRGVFQGYDLTTLGTSKSDDITYIETRDQNPYRSQDKDIIVATLPEPITIYLPPNPSQGASVRIADGGTNFSVNYLTVISETDTIEGANQPYVIRQSGNYVFVYGNKGGSMTWMIMKDSGHYWFDTGANDSYFVTYVDFPMSPYTPKNKELMYVDSETGAITIELPYSPRVADKVQVQDFGMNASNNHITITAPGRTIDSLDQSLLIYEDGEAITFTWTYDEQGVLTWIPRYGNVDVYVTIEDVLKLMEEYGLWTLERSKMVPVSPTKYTVAGNKTDVYYNGKAIRLTNSKGENYYGRVNSTSYDSGTDTTTIDLRDCNAVDTSALKLYYGLDFITHIPHTTPTRALIGDFVRLVDDGTGKPGFGTIVIDGSNITNVDAKYLEGHPASYFLDTSANEQTKIGTLNLQNKFNVAKEVKFRSSLDVDGVVHFYNALTVDGITKTNRLNVTNDAVTGTLANAGSATTGSLTVSGHSALSTVVASGLFSGTDILLTGDITARYLIGTAQKAWLGDLAEYYISKDEAEVGTVMEICTESGYDVQICRGPGSNYIVGVVSNTAGHVMGCEREHEKGATLVGLIGRLPVYVVGEVEKGDVIVSCGNGYACSIKHDLNDGVIIGVALETNYDDRPKKVMCLIR